MEKLIIPGGEAFTEIDILACANAYKELLNREGKECDVILPGPFNKSITEDIKNWGINYKTKYQEETNTSFIIVDISVPKHLPKFVNQEKILKLFDHHSGYENYWRNKLGENAVIELIGACATLIWEEYKKAVIPLEISPVSANLLYTAIVSNTLNFKASVTHQRDTNAFNELKNHIFLESNWIEKYFADQEIAVNKNPIEETINDTFSENFPSINKTLTISQLELWDSKNFIDTHMGDIKKLAQKYKDRNWFFTSPSISEGVNYIYSKDYQIKEILNKLIGVEFNGNLGKTQKLWLRKEIKKKIHEVQK